VVDSKCGSGHRRFSKNRVHNLQQVGLLKTRKKESKNALREFAIGIRKSFTKNGVVDLKESTATRWNVKGIRMVFSIPTEDSKVNCDAFFLRQGDRFWAVMAFGPDQEKLAAAHDALIKK
jgi:hypothetical protein